MGYTLSPPHNLSISLLTCFATIYVTASALRAFSGIARSTFSSLRPPLGFFRYAICLCRCMFLGLRAGRIWDMGAKKKGTWPCIRITASAVAVYDSRHAMNRLIGTD